MLCDNILNSYLAAQFLHKDFLYSIHFFISHCQICNLCYFIFISCEMTKINTADTFRTYIHEWFVADDKATATDDDDGAARRRLVTAAVDASSAVYRTCRRRRRHDTSATYSSVYESPYISVGTAFGPLPLRQLEVASCHIPCQEN